MSLAIRSRQCLYCDTTTTDDFDAINEHIFKQGNHIIILRHGLYALYKYGFSIVVDDLKVKGFCNAEYFLFVRFFTAINLDE